MITSASSNQFKYRDNWPDPMEFIYRGKVRSEKDIILEESESKVDQSRIHLKETIQALLHEFVNPEEDRGVSVVQKIPKASSCFTRFYEWLKGTDRDIRLQNAVSKAIANEAKVITLHYKLAYINKLQEKSERKAARYLEAALDAQVHNGHTKSGWTWWR